LCTPARYATVYLAAAVSDFYVPWDNLPKHKIQSRAAAAGPGVLSGGGDGDEMGITLRWGQTDTSHTRNLLNPEP